MKKTKSCAFCHESYPEEKLQEVIDSDGEKVKACEYCIG